MFRHDACGPIGLYVDFLQTAIVGQGVVMEGVQELVNRLKEHFRVEKDADLARVLGVDKRTVSAWRSRGNVPRRYVPILEGENHQSVLTPPLRWGE